MREIIHKDKDGNIIEDLSKAELPEELHRDIFEILNPGLEIVRKDNNIKEK